MVGAAGCCERPWRRGRGVLSTHPTPPSQHPPLCLPENPARRQGDESGAHAALPAHILPHTFLSLLHLSGGARPPSAPQPSPEETLAFSPLFKNSLRFIFWQHGKPPGRTRGSSRARAGRGGGGRRQRAGNNPPAAAALARGKLLRCEQCVVDVETPRAAATAGPAHPALWPSCLLLHPMAPQAPHPAPRPLCTSTWVCPDLSLMSSHPPWYPPWLYRGEAR